MLNLHRCTPTEPAKYKQTKATQVYSVNDGAATIVAITLCRLIFGKYTNVSKLDEQFLCVYRSPIYAYVGGNARVKAVQYTKMDCSASERLGEWC